MFKFLRKDPIDKARKHVERALREIEDGYLDYACAEYEKAALLFIEAGSSEFAVKYYREAASCALEDDDHTKAADMKVCAAETLLRDSVFDESGSLYQEASDHYYRDSVMSDSYRTLSLSIMAHLAARSFDTAVNLLRKLEKRLPEKSAPKIPAYDVANLFVEVLVEGFETSQESLTKCAASFKPRESEAELFQFLMDSVRLALDTHVTIEWAGQQSSEVSAKTPLEFELLYNSPVPVRVLDYRLSLSNSLTFLKEPEIHDEMRADGSWLLTVNPVLSGEGVIGPFKLTLSGDRMLVHKHSNKIEFSIAKAPSLLSMNLSPERISCGIGDEVVLDISMSNTGEGPAENISLKIALSDGISLSLGNNERSIEYLGANESMRLQLYVRGVTMGDEFVTVTAKDGRAPEEIVKSATIRVG